MDCRLPVNRCYATVMDKGNKLCITVTAHDCTNAPVCLKFSYVMFRVVEVHLMTISKNTLGLRNR